MKISKAASRRVAARYVAKKAADDRKTLQWGKTQLQKALGLMDDVTLVWGTNRTPPPGHGAEGYESLAAAFPQVQQVIDAIEKAGKILANPVRGLKQVRLAFVKPVILDRKQRRPIMQALKKKGLDGNGRFEKPERGYAAAVGVLGDFGIELDDIPSSHLFRPDSNIFTVHIAYSDKTDPFSPVPIKNSMLSISFTKLLERKYEVLAYLT